MDNYTANGTITAVTAAPGDTALALFASLLTRGRLYWFDLAIGGTPQDFMMQWLVRRFTAVGTYTAVVPRPDDPAAPAAQTTEFEKFLHLRAPWQWNARPGGELVIPATGVATGVGFTPIQATYAAAASVIAKWTE
jgi:hypothetical protein